MNGIIKKLIYKEFVEPPVGSNFIWSSPQLAYAQAPIDDEFEYSYLPLEGRRHTDLILAHLLSDCINVTNRRDAKQIYSYYCDYGFADAFIRHSKDNNCFYASISSGLINKICDISQACGTTFLSSLRESCKKSTTINLDPRGDKYNSPDALSRALNSEDNYYDIGFSDFIFSEAYQADKNPNMLKSDAIEDARMCFLLFADMLKFVWLHEWFHVSLGHFDDASTSGNVFEATEGFNFQSIDEETLFSIRAFEFDADFHACNYLLKSVYSGLDSNGSLINYQGTSWNRLAIMRLAHMLITIYWSKTDKEKSEHKRRHPTALSRVYYIANIYNMFILSKKSDEFTEHFGRKIKILSPYVRELEILDPDPDDLLPNDISLEKDWDKLSSSLRPEYVLAMDESDRYIKYLSRQ